MKSLSQSKQITAGKYDPETNGSKYETLQLDFKSNHRNNKKCFLYIRQSSLRRACIDLEKHFRRRYCEAGYIKMDGFKFPLFP